MSAREQQVFDMAVADVYVHYLRKIEKKDRTEAELIKVISWLTGFDAKIVKSHLSKNLRSKSFLRQQRFIPMQN